ncbi:hypothetical protein SAMN04487890_1036 [Mucilaginibacter polytrichastri]|nr:hypothetical protein SAMN04487890_1036 [Mucilaginibacter polytrichastri]
MGTVCAKTIHGPAKHITPAATRAFAGKHGFVFWGLAHLRVYVNEEANLVQQLLVQVDLLVEHVKVNILAAIFFVPDPTTKTYSQIRRC